MPTLNARPTADTKMGRIRLWEMGETTGPWELTVLPTNRCNLTCKHCWLRGAESEPGGVDLSQVPDERMLRLVDEAAALGVREWNFVGGGEPMLRGPLIMEMCRKIREYGMNGALHTNGTAMTEARLRELVEMGWSRVIFSLDAPRAEVNDPLRGEKSFERATRTIKRLKQIKEAYGPSCETWTIINMVITNTNYKLIPEMVDRCHEWGVGHFSASLLLNMNDDCWKYELDEAQRDELEELFDQGLRKAKQYGVDVNFEGMKSIEQKLTQGVIQEGCCSVDDFSESACYESWLGLTIVPSGYCGPCCVAFDRQSDNINTMSLEEVWHGPYLTDVRERLRTRSNLMHYCSYCPSNLQLKTADYRARLLAIHAREERPWIGQLAVRFGEELRDKGLTQTLRRTWEWVQIHSGRAHAN